MCCNPPIRMAARIAALALLLMVFGGAVFARPVPTDSVRSRQTAWAKPPTVGGSTRTSTAATSPAPASCLIYGVNDEGLDDSQFFTLDPVSGTTNALGSLYADHDIEGLDIHPSTNVIYAAAGSGGVLDGYLYTVDARTGLLAPVGSTGFREVVALSFRPTDGTLWGWSEGSGLIQIDVATGRGVLRFAAPQNIEGLAWNNAGTLLYGSSGTHLWVYDPGNNSLTRVASNLPGTTEALDMRPDGLLMGGLDTVEQGNIFSYDVSTFEPVAGQNIVIPYNDVEGVAWPDSCGNLPRPDTDEPNDLCTDAIELEPNTIYSSYLSHSSDVDFYKIYVAQPYTTLTVRLSHPTQDYDLALYDACVDTGGIRWARHVGQTRGAGEEVLVYDIGPNWGWYFVQVVGFAGAYCATPYTIEASLTPPGPFGTLILTHRDRLTDRYDAIAVHVLFNQLNELAAHPSVAGLLLDVASDAGVRAAYADWDANPRSPVRANNVAAAIKGLIRSTLQQYPTIRYLVIVGSDAIIPFYRLPVRPYGTGPTLGWETENAYLNAIGQVWNENDPTVAALRNNLTLTDDFYGSDQGIPFQDHRLYIPERSVGRLVETPEEMGAVIDAFLTANGISQPDNVLAVGGYFIADAAEAACVLFTADGLPATCRADNGWDATWLRSVLLDAPPDVASVNAHASHFSFLAPAGGQLKASDIVNTPASLKGLLLYTLGCQTGLNVPLGNPEPLDFPQALAGRGASLVGNTGWSYGIVGGFGLSETLVKLFTDTLVNGSSTTVGDALREAKRMYYLSERGFDHYDEKVLTELTLYGLPMLRVLTPGSGSMAGLSGRVHWMGQDPATERQVRAVQHDSGPGLLSAGPTLERRELWFDDLDQETTPWGTYYTYRGDTRADPGLPLQPRYVASTFANSGPVHGVALIGGTYTDLRGFNPVIGMPLNPNQVAPRQEPAFGGSGWAPAAFFGLQYLPGVLGDGTAEALVVDLGQFDGRQAIERLYNQVSLMLYRSDSDDWAPPAIAGVRAAPVAGGVQVTVGAVDASGMYAVVVAYTSGDGAWHSVELMRTADGVWQGTIPVSGELSFFVQAVDMAGNVTVDVNGGLYYGPCFLCGDVESVHLPVIMR